MRINGEMLTLAREYRDLRQQEVAEAIGVSQSLIAKLESGLKSEMEDAAFNKIVDVLNFPARFFTQTEQLLGFGSSAYFYRKRSSIPASERRRIHCAVNLQRIAIKKYTDLIDIDPSKKLPLFDIEEYANSASNIARALRVAWGMPDGPVRNLTAIVESAGILVVPCDFGTNAFDATSLRLADMPPVVFMNSNVPGDRWRFTLAHELGHLVMHTVPHERMEEEANEFAAEFLTPASEITPNLIRMKAWRMPDVVQLKLFWKVSMAMLLTRAHDLKIFSDEEVKKLYIRNASIRRQEPYPLDQEKANSIFRTIETIRDDLEFGIAGIAELNRWPEDVTQKFLFSSLPAPARLRIVR